MRCDLHVHTVHSGMCGVPLMKHICRECYSEPEAVYDRLKRLGMNLVTVTDHDSIDAGEVLRHHPDFFVSEEVTCRMPSGTEIHIGAYDISEHQHIEIRERRDDLPRLIAYFREQDIPYSLNHAFSSLTGRRDESDWDWFYSLFPILEIRNGHMLPVVYDLAARLAKDAKKAGVAGSDAHTLFSLGSAFTEVHGARNRAEFIEGLRTHQARVRGGHGTYWKLTRDLLFIAMKMIEERPATVPLLPLALLIPVASLGNYFRELGFARRWKQSSVDRDSDLSPTARPIGSEGFAL